MIQIQRNVILGLLSIGYGIVAAACDDLDPHDASDSQVTVLEGAELEEPDADKKPRLIMLLEERADNEPIFARVNNVDEPSDAVDDGADGPAPWPEDMDLISEPPDAPEPLTGGTGWHYTTWPATGFRPYNPSGCGGTKYCTFGPGTWVRWAGTAGTCGIEPWDVYVHDTPCGSGWVRADALN